MNSSDSDRRRDLRCSTRVPIHVRIEVQTRGLTCDGETVVVNLRGALLRTSERLEVGEQVKLHCSLTGKFADARVVFADADQVLHFGIALDRPENIWGISLPPSDWEERTSDTKER